MRALFYQLCCLAVFTTTAHAAPTPVFIPNKGQIADTKGNLHPEILFKYEGQDLNLYFLKDRLVYHFIRSEEKQESEYTAQDHENKRQKNFGAIGKKVYFHRMDLVFENANADVQLVSEEKAKSYSNFYLGHCPQGILNVEQYGKLVYKNLYPGIDLAFYFKDGTLKYDFIVSPGADHQQVKMVYEGAKSLEQLSSGEILVKTPVASLTERTPYTYDKTTGKEIPSKYILNGTSISFALGETPINSTTIIDPTVTWATYFNNGTSTDNWTKPAFDATGAFYNAAFTYYAAYPLINAGSGQYFDNTKDGITDLVIVKFSSTYAYTWSTYYGGNDGEYVAGYTDYGKALAVDASNNVYVAGSTMSTDFPTHNPGGSAFYQDQTKVFSETPFFVKLNAGGVCQWASIFHHENANTMNAGMRVNGICIGNNKLYFTGQSYRFNSNDVPMRTLAGAYNNSGWRGPQDVFIGRFDVSTHALEWSTYLNDGGSSTASYRQGTDLHCDNTGLWFVGIHTVNTSNAGHYLLNPGGGAYYQGTNAGSSDMIITKFNTSMNVVYSTYYGGNGAEGATMINVNNTGDAVITVRGVTSTNFPVLNPGGGAYYQPTRSYTTTTDGDAGLVKLSSAGVLQWATYYGGTGGYSNFNGVGFDNSNNNIYVFGSTQAWDFPTQSLTGSFNDMAMSGTGDAVLLRFSNGGVRHWATFHGGTGIETLYGSKGEVYNGSCSVKLLTFPFSTSSNFPTVNPGGGAFYEATATTANANTILLLEETSGGLSTAPTGATATATSICAGNSTTLSVTGGVLGTGAQWQWYMDACGAVSVGSGSSLSVSPTATTTYYVRAEGPCNTTTCQAVTINVNTPSTAPTSASSTVSSLCSGTSTTLSVTGGSLGTGASWQWYTGSCGGTSAGSGSTLTVSPTATTTYFVRAEGTCNTTTCQSVTVTVNTVSTAATSATATATSICAGNSTTLSVTGGVLGTGASWQWYTDACGVVPVGSGSTLTVSPTVTTTYYVRAEGPCNTTTCQAVTITVNTPSTAATSVNVSAPAVCPGISSTLTVVGGSLGTGAQWVWYTGSCGGTAIATGSSITVNTLVNMTYYVRAEGTCNTTTCVSGTVTVNEISMPASSIGTMNTAICPGETIDLSVTGGSLGTGAQWQWYSGSCGGTPVGTGSTVSVTPTATTTYYVQAAGGVCGNTTCENITITLNTLSVAPASATASSSAICKGTAATLTANGGTLGTGADYIWYTGSCNGTFAGVGPTLNVTPTMPTTYYVNIAGACNITTCQTVTVGIISTNTPPASINATSTNLCETSGMTFTAVGATLGAGAEYTWYEGSCGGTVLGSGSSITVNPTAPTSYFVNVTGGCNNTTCEQIDVTASPVSAAWNPPATGLCSSVTNYDLDTLLAGSTPPIGTWYGPGVTAGHLFNPAGLSGDVTLSYVLGSVFCKDSVAHDITILASPLSPVVNTSMDSICIGTSVTISTTSSDNVYTTPAGGTAIGTTPLVVSPTANITYYVEAVNDAGCVNEGGRVPVVIYVSPAVTANAGPDIQHCTGEQLTITASGGGSYNWNTGSSNAAINVSPNVDTVYWVTVSSGACTDTDSVFVNTIGTGDIMAANDNASVTAGNAVTTDVAANDTGDPLTVTIINGPSNGTVSVNSNGDIVYTAHAGFNGTDTVEYSICHNLCGNVCTTARLVIEVKQVNDIKIPGGISPNGDGMNDVWYITGLEAYPTNEVVIFNRWGDIVFTAAPYLNNWRGQSTNKKLKLTGDEVVDGTYYYIVKLIPGEKEINGPIEIIRNK